ncbi:hypothetical protein [Pantoea agglomerans]|uniref:hypothetical protein n=1 Tax=Enterobacter agglomerans TaxID=549 RepID=UPI001654A79C|nr:hypothetical protein [Pantoea agglomerans]
MLIYVGDAIGRMMHLQLCQSEAAFGYIVTTHSYDEKYGKPIALYSENASLFQINNKNAAGYDGQTQLWRSVNKLNTRL